MSDPTGKFEAVYELVKEIPVGQVASYGMIASLLNGVTARMVGYAMAATPPGQGIPWQRVINSAGKVSDRPGADRQRQALVEEGIVFSESGKVHWQTAVWGGPDEAWLEAHGYDIIDFLDIQAKWPGR